MRMRVIPVLLLHKGGLYKTVKFSKPTYVGDPINAVRIFNDKEVDELVILDIDAGKAKRPPNFNQISDIVSEAFMPIAYGGGISNVDEAAKLFYNGVEKVVLNSSILSSQQLIRDIAERFGNQSIIASIDFKKKRFGSNKIHSHSQHKVPNISVESFAKQCEDAGAGEIMLNSVDRDGTYNGYDCEMISRVSSSVTLPVIVCGGAGNKTDFTAAIQHGASAVAAGSMFVFQRPNQAVLIQYTNSYR